MPEGTCPTRFIRNALKTTKLAAAAAASFPKACALNNKDIDDADDGPTFQNNGKFNIYENAKKCSRK